MQTDMLMSAAKTLGPMIPNQLAGTGSIAGAQIPVAGEAAIGEAPFAGLMREAVTTMKALEDKASGMVEGLIGGKGVDIHAAMLATGDADLAFEMALAVRGKAVAAYQSLMGVQF